MGMVISIKIIKIALYPILIGLFGYLESGAGEDCKQVQPLWKSVWQFLRKLGIILWKDPAIPLLGIYPEDSPAYNKDTYSTMFIEALFIIARTWKEPRYP